jgi:hypothetical protein
LAGVGVGTRTERQDTASVAFRAHPLPAATVSAKY